MQDIWEWLDKDAEDCWWDKESDKGFDLLVAERYIIIKTLEGFIKADEDDWAIKGVKGEFYPCKPDIFKLTYEVCDET